MRVYFHFFFSLLEKKIHIFVFMTILILADMMNILKGYRFWDEILDWGKQNISLALDGKINI